MDGVTARNVEEFAGELKERLEALDRAGEARQVVHEHMVDQRAIAEQIRRKMS